MRININIDTPVKDQIKSMLQTKDLRDILEEWIDKNIDDIDKIYIMYSDKKTHGINTVGHNISYTEVLGLLELTKIFVQDEILGNTEIVEEGMIKEEDD